MRPSDAAATASALFLSLAASAPFFWASAALLARPGKALRLLSALACLLSREAAVVRPRRERQARAQRGGELHGLILVAHDVPHSAVLAERVAARSGKLGLRLSCAVAATFSMFSL